MSPAKTVELRYINKLSHCAIWFVGIKEDFTLEANGLNYQFGKFVDGEFFACAHVNVAVADLTKGWDGASTTSGVVAIDNTIGCYTIVNG